MQLEANITLSYKTIREAEAVAKAVTPDNMKVPPGLYIKTTRRVNRVQTRIECQTRLQTFNATIDDFLSAISVAEKSLATIRKH